MLPAKNLIGQSDWRRSRHDEISIRAPSIGSAGDGGFFFGG
jgi:hypothetical protein